MEMWLVFLVEMFHAVIKALSEQCLHFVLFLHFGDCISKP